MDISIITDSGMESVKVHGNTKIRTLVKNVSDRVGNAVAVQSLYNVDWRISEIPTYRKVLFVDVRNGTAFIHPLVMNISFAPHRKTSRGGGFNR